MTEDPKDLKGRTVLTTLGETCPQCKRRNALVVLAEPRGEIACEHCDYIDKLEGTP